MKHADALSELKAYLSNLQYMYSLGGMYFNTHYFMVKSIRDYVDYLKEKYE